MTTRKSLLSATLLLLFALLTSCLGEIPVGKAINGVDKLRLEVQLDADDKSILSNQNVDLEVEIQANGQFRENYFQDSGDTFRYREKDECDKYVGRLSLDRSTARVVAYKTPPFVNGTTLMTQNDVKVDSFAKINRVFYLQDGKTTSNDFKGACTLADFEYDSIYSMLLTVSLKATEKTCNTYCGVKVKTHCQTQCSSSSYSSYYSSSSSSSCNQSCKETEIPFCKETCSEQETIVAQASIYPDEVIDKTDTSASNTYNASMIGAGGSGNIDVDDEVLKQLIVDKNKKEATLRVKLKLEDYKPLNY